MESKISTCSVQGYKILNNSFCTRLTSTMCKNFEYEKEQGGASVSINDVIFKYNCTEEVKILMVIEIRNERHYFIVKD